MVLPEEAQEFLEKLPIEKFHGVGKKSVERLHDMDIYTGADLLMVPEMTLIDRFGRFGFDLFRKARGISNSPVRLNQVSIAFKNLTNLHPYLSVMAIIS